MTTLLLAAVLGFPPQAPLPPQAPPCCAPLPPQAPAVSVGVSCGCRCWAGEVCRCGSACDCPRARPPARAPVPVYAPVFAPVRFGGGGGC